jgi:hypothetical protein
MTILVVAAGCSGSGAPTSSGSSRGLPGSRFTLSVRGETAYLDPATSTTVMLPEGGRVTAPGGIDCGISSGLAWTRCAASYPWTDPPTTVTITATPDAAAGYAYFAFASACVDSGPCAVAVTSDRFVAVRFARTQAGLGSHSNFSDGAIHGPKYDAWHAGAPGALDCSACHGPRLRGQGIAPSCAQCHAWPRGTGGALTWDQGNWDEKVWQ